MLQNDRRIGRQRGEINAGLTSDRAYSSISVEHVRGGVPLHRQHGVQVDLVVTLQGVGKIEILDRRQAYRLGHGVRLVWRKRVKRCASISRLVLGDRAGSFDGLIQKLAELGCASLPRLERSPVGGQDVSETQVFKRHLLIYPTQPPHRREQHRKMLLLRQAHDVDDSIGLERVHAVQDGGQI